MTQEFPRTISPWMETAPGLAEVTLANDTRASVCVVGAGIAGLSTAYLLAKEGRDVVVVDAGSIGAGQTCRTTAHLASAIDDRFVEMERLHGERGARLAAESHAHAIDFVEAVCAEEGIACDFTRVDGFLIPGANASPDLMGLELQAARRAGLTGVKRLKRAPTLSFNTGPCLRFPRQAQFHPMKYLAGLARAIVKLGGRIYGSVPIVGVTGGFPAIVTAASGVVIRADNVIVATNSPINDRFVIHTKQAPYMTYVVGLPVPVGFVPRALFWDTEDPYHYVRLEQGGATLSREGDAGRATEILLVGGEDHKTGQAHDAEARYERLVQWARDRFPVAGEPIYRWCGQVLETIDGLAFIGRNPLDTSNIYVATGDSGMGMTHGTIAGLLLSDLILGRENPWTELYEPSRVPVMAAREWAKENLNVAAQYADYVTAGEVSRAEDIAPGEGAIVREGLRKLAVYRDPKGGCHSCSAVCPHLGGIVSWNSADKTWDCPLHGSRFDAFGKVLNGPASCGLSAPLEEKKTG